MAVQAALQSLGSYAQATLDHIHILHMGPWATLASLSFFIAALMGGDVLALRGALLLAYIFNLLNGLTGVPTWPYIDWKGRLNVDMVFWAVAAGCLHGCSVLRMLMDEMPVKFANEDDEQLARFFNRRGGMERLEAREVLQRGVWTRVAAGQQIADGAQIHERVFLVVEGRCQLLRFRTGQQTTVTAAIQQPYQGVSSHDQILQPNTQDVEQQQQHATYTFTSTAGQCIPTVDNAVRSFALWDAASDDDSSSPPLTSFVYPAAQQQHSSSSHSPADESYVLDVMPAAVHAPLDTASKAAVDIAAAAGYQAPMLDSSTITSSNSMCNPSFPGAVFLQQAPTSAVSNTMSQQQSATGTFSSPASRVLVDQLVDRPVKLSGDMFSMGALNVFGVYIGFDWNLNSQLEAWAETDCLLFSWPMSAMEDMATRCSPSLASYWRNFITYSLASEFEKLAYRHLFRHRCSTGEAESAEYSCGARSRDFTDALRHYEQPERVTLRSLMAWLKRALSPFPPRGLRHTALPTSGVMARNRVLAVATEQACASAARGVASEGSAVLQRDVCDTWPADHSLRQALLEKLPLM